MSEKTVIIVEDDADIANLLSRLVVSYGAKPVICEESEAVTKTLKTHDVSLALLDILLPGDDGRQIASMLREQKVSFPIYFMTGVAKQDITKDYYNLADGFLRKPFGIKELREILDRVFQTPAKKGEDQSRTVLELMAVVASEQENIRREQTRLQAMIKALPIDTAPANKAIGEEFSSFGMGLEASLSRLASRLEGVQKLLDPSK